MTGPSSGQSWPGLDEVVDAFETARSVGEPADLAEFLPPRDHPQYLAILCELIRVDLEYGWQDGRPHRLAHYRGRFPELFEDGRYVEEIAFEEFRLRRQADEHPSPREYRRRFGAGTLDWPSSLVDSLDSESGVQAPGRAHVLQPGGEIAENVAQTATAYREYQEGRSGEQASLVAAFSSRRVAPGPAELFLDLDRSDSNFADSLARAVTGFPPVCSTFLGFRLEEELGARGPLGRVYLARQGGTCCGSAGRAEDLRRTSSARTRALAAQLRHANIVPIYSVHRLGPLQADLWHALPLGSGTLADVLRELRLSQTLPDSGAALLSSHRRRPSTSEFRPEGPHEGPRLRRQGDGPPLEDSTRDPASDAAGLGSRIEELGYVQAVLWLVARLADGLAHAHERGILHRDPQAGPTSCWATTASPCCSTSTSPPTPSCDRTPRPPP